MDPQFPYARPPQRLTPQGNPMREILSYARRGSRLTARQEQAWDAYADRWFLPDSQVASGIDVAALFGRDAPLIVDIGPGIGEATATLAAQRADCNVLAFEVWRPGVAETLGRVGDLGITNVRICSVDAAWAMRDLFRDASVAELWTFYPDPWHKKKHHKRRLITANFAALVASRLEQGAHWRLATDWADYADQIAEVLGSCSAFVGGRVERWPDRPSTRFERRGVVAGRDLHDFAFRRVADSPWTR